MNIMLLLLLLCRVAQTKEILISFDGSKSLEKWEGTLNLAKEYNLKYTYFISIPYFVTKHDLGLHPYWALQEIGKSPIPFQSNGNETEEDIDMRWKYVIQAQHDGHEIASHLCGHYDGSKWTREQWIKEIEFFRWVTTESFAFHHTEKLNIVGIRAPGLDVNTNYFDAIFSDGHFEYDSSIVNDGGTIHILKYMEEIPVRMIDVVIDKQKLAGMWHIHKLMPFDYDFNVAISAKYMRQIYFDSLCWDYLNNTQPTQICLHFEKQDGEAYYKAMQDFVRWVADKNPTYHTYREWAGVLRNNHVTH